LSFVSSWKYPSDPRARRHGGGLSLELVDDALDRDELHFERIADQHLVEEGGAAGVVVTIDEAGHDGHLPGVEGLGPFADEPADVGAASDSDEATALQRECLGARRGGVHRVDAGVKDHEVGVADGRRQPPCVAKP